MNITKFEIKKIVSRIRTLQSEGILISDRNDLSFEIWNSIEFSISYGVEFHSVDWT